MNEREAVEDAARGRHAERPAEIPAPGWRDILWRVWRELGRDNVALIAAGLAMYALLAAFPALIAALAIYGFFATSSEAAQHAAALFEIMPDDAAALFQDRLAALAAREQEALGLGAVLGVLVALWSARRGMSAMIMATNIAYEEQERRGFFHRVLLSLLFTLGAVLCFIVVLALAVAAPVGVEAAELPRAQEVVLLGARWALLWVFLVFALAVIYRFAPDRANARWRWVTWGSALAATLWLLGSVLFSMYVRNFGSYGETYGALGGVVVLLLWFYMSGYVIVLGAELNAEIEHQTTRDSTTGTEQPLGQRGAFVADHVGESRAGASQGTSSKR